MARNELGGLLFEKAHFIYSHLIKEISIIRRRFAIAQISDQQSICFKELIRFLFRGNHFSSQTRAKLREEGDKKSALADCGKEVVTLRMNEEILKNWEKKSGDRQKLYKQYLHRADKNKVLRQLPALHEEAFSKIDCLKCANCCKNYSPRFKTTDIKRIAKHLRVKESVLIETYLVVDDEGDYVVKSRPCPFLGADNFCTIYDKRPSDCRRFPYTNEDVIVKRPQLTLKNTTFCPITYFVIEKLLEVERKK